MSRIGNKEIKVSDSVLVNIRDKNFVCVEGPQGKLEYQFNKKLDISFQDKIIKITRPNNEIFMKKIHGTTRALLFNMVTGVEKGFQKRFKLVGLEYKADLQGNILILFLGFSHPVKISIPSDITVNLITNTEIVVKGIDKQRVGEFVAKIVKLRKPEPYKGKGVVCEGAYVFRKAGKSSKK